MHGPKDYSPSLDDLEEPNISETPSYWPKSIPEHMIPRPLKEETKFWTTGKGQKLTDRSAYALAEAEAIMTGLVKSGIMQEMGLNLDAPKHMSIKGHSTRVAVHALLTNDKLEKYHSPSQSTNPRALALAGLLHDIGKLHPKINRIVMSDAKWGEDALMAWEIIKQHPTIGAEVVYAMPGFDTLRERMTVANAVYEHHENFDGTGYHGLMGRKICPEGRILRLVDTIDAIGEARTYKGEEPTPIIMTEVEKNSRMFDPEVYVVAKKIQESSGVFSRHRISERP